MLMKFLLFWIKILCDYLDLCVEKVVLLRYPIVGIKSYEFEWWIKLVDIYFNKKQVGKDINTKNFILKFAEISKE